jgi:hypothetical protein
MKHIFSVFSIACVAFFTIFLSTTNTGCKKGDTGPKGDTGIANMTYSAWLNVTYQQQVPQPGDTFFVATINAPKLTAEVLGKSDVHVYINWGTASAPNVSPIPYFDGLFLINPEFEVGKITLFSNVNAGTNLTSQVRQYRYIIAEGSIPARSGLDWSDYKKVAEYYKIED